MEFVNYKKYKKQVKKLYKSAFPYEERYPMPILFWKTRNKKYRFDAIVEKDEFVGLVYTMEEDKFLYVFYLAIMEEKRGEGLGSRVLSTLKEMYPSKAVCLTIEDTEKVDAPNYAQRMRRLEFYRRSGFRQMHMKVNEAGVDFEILATDDILFDDFIAMMRKYLGKILFKMVYKALTIPKNK